MGYTVDQLIRVAKRDKNKRRNYLLVNPLQGKHVPVSPTVSLAMMKDLAAKAHIENGEKCTVIGFAETATAIGACLASELGNGSNYIQTTRERLEGKEIIAFKEEHSHAVAQSICKESLRRALSHSDKLVIVDDEFSTGHTLVNALRAMREEVCFSDGVDIEAISVVNRMSEENLEKAKNEGISFTYEASFPNDKYVDVVNEVDTVSAEAPVCDGFRNASIVHCKVAVPNPRIGSRSDKYRAACLQAAMAILEKVDADLSGASRVLVLGTEECMYPSLVLGSAIEERYPDIIVRSHATTRSPIGISSENGYPIQNGARLRSLYDPERTTFLYNLSSYDLAIAITDAKGDIAPGVEDLSCALAMHGCPKTMVAVV